MTAPNSVSRLRQGFQSDLAVAIDFPSTRSDLRVAAAASTLASLEDPLAGDEDLMPRLGVYSSLAQKELDPQLNGRPLMPDISRQPLPPRAGGIFR